jgi:hypothetical protein
LLVDDEELELLLELDDEELLELEELDELLLDEDELLELEDVLDVLLEELELVLLDPLIEPVDAVSVTRSIRAPSSRRCSRKVCEPAARLLNVVRVSVE